MKAVGVDVSTYQGQNIHFFWNHHEFERGKRVGSSPLELAGVEDVPSLAEVLDQLFRPSVAAQPA